jgi:anti-sigma factor RsiW
MDSEDGDAVTGARSHVAGRVLSTNRMAESTIPCDELIAFVDGELDPERAAAFRMHLRTCEACEEALVEAIQLTARLSELAPRSKR